MKANIYREMINSCEIFEKEKRIEIRRCIQIERWSDYWKLEVESGNKQVKGNTAFSSSQGWGSMSATATQTECGTFLGFLSIIVCFYTFGTTTSNIIKVKNKVRFLQHA